MAATLSEQKPFLAGKKIIVAGAGLAGLSFVIALRKQWTTLTSDRGSALDPITITIYERDTIESAAQRAGYSMSIRSDGFSGGMQAMIKLGLFEPLLRSGLVLGGGFTYWGLDWKEMLQVKKPSSDKEVLPSLRIERNALRQILLDAVASDDVIHWGNTCVGAEQLPNGRVRVSLSDGGIDECDLLIAADGANSKIRTSLRPNDKLNFAGAVIICAQSKFPNHGVPQPMDRDWGSVIGGGGVGLFVAPMGEGTVLWALSYEVPEPIATMKAPLAEEKARELIDDALSRGKRFNEPFQSIVRGTDLSTIWMLNAKDKSPFGHVDGKKKCRQVIFIGDSNHAMSPFAGNGANMALMDGWELAAQLCSSSSLLDALTSYDASSIPRSKSAIKKSHLAISMMHANGLKLMFYIFILKLVKFLFFRK